MTRCDTCGSMIVFGGESWRGMRFCCEDCVQSAFTAATLAAGVPEDSVIKYALKLRDAPCPECGGEGPNDFHIAWSVYSLLIPTYRSRQELLACQRCGTLHKLKYFLFTGLFGWWGIPWGIVMTPYYEFLNLMNLFRGVPSGPSEELKQEAVTQMAEELRRSADDQNQGSGRS